MNRFLLAAIVAIPLFSTASLMGADDPPKREIKIVPSKAQALKDNPNDLKAFNAFMQESLASVFSSLQAEKPDEAEQKLAEMKATLDAITPDEAAAKQLLTRAKGMLQIYGNQVELARVSLADLEKKLDANPDDVAALDKYRNKLQMSLNQQARTAPDEASKLLDAAKQRLAKLKEAAKVDNSKSQIDAIVRSFAAVERTIEGGKKLANLIGKEAAPLEVDAWVNGVPLSDADLKGKVVLLDFWAVWCGPCIATFPHLREWQEKYADKGLVMVGITSYYGYTWDDATGKAKRSQGEVSAEDEREMLTKFAAQHDLHHRFAVQKKGDRTLSEYYAVSGIPHVVLLDREGKVRLVRVGSGEKNAKDIEEMLEKLLAAK